MKKVILSIMLTAGAASAWAQEPGQPADSATDSVALSSVSLDEVVVKAEKPQLSGKDGIMTVDLPAIVKGKPVTNVLEALGYLPGVTDNGGKIALTGTDQVTIILNGEPTNMPVGNLYQLLSSTPVDRLKNVEIMYTAPAKYHVSGAVINVNLRTPRPIDGLQAQVRTGYTQTRYATFGAGFAATYAVGAWAFDLNYSLSRSKTFARESQRSDHLVGHSRTLVEENQNQASRSITNNIYASATYKFSEKSNLKLTYNARLESHERGANYATGTFGSFVNRHTYPSPPSFHYLSFRYQMPWSTVIGGDYTHYSERSGQHLSSLTTGEAKVISANSQRINRLHLYADQTHDIADWELSYGIEYQHSDDRSSQRYILPENSGFDGSTEEQLFNAYLGFGHSFPFGLSLNASGKAEIYKRDGKSRRNLTPQLGATFYKTHKSIFQLNLSTLRIYPSYWELHGATTYLTDYSVIEGNPQLQPSLNYSGQFSYIFMRKYIATLYVQYKDKGDAQLPYQSPDELKLIFKTLNMDYKRTVGLNIHIPFNIRSLLKSSATVNIFHQREKASHFHDISFDNKKWIFYGGLDNTLRLSSKIPVALSLDFAYVSPSLQGLSDLTKMWRLDAGLKWNFGKDRTCELDLKYEDMFNTWSPTMTIKSHGQDFRMKIYDMSRNFKLTFLWRFNGFKPKDTSIDTSRFGAGR